jgi:uncharacterized damage-inducible protein DinB
MKTFFGELLDYSHHYNNEIIMLFSTHPDKVSERAQTLISHVVNAHAIWNSRILNQESKVGVWQLNDMENLKKWNVENLNTSKQILDQFELEQIVKYINTKGQAFESSIRDILFHVINHSTHHRAQLATEIKIAGMEPIVMDYIFYKR